MKIKTKYFKHFIVLSAMLVVVGVAHMVVPMFRNAIALEGPSFVLQNFGMDVPYGGQGNGHVWHRINRAYFKLSTPTDRDIWVSTEMTASSNNATRDYLFPMYQTQLTGTNTVFSYGEGSSTNGAVQICKFGVSPCNDDGVIYVGEWARVPKNSHFQYILNTRTELMQTNKIGKYRITYKKMRWREIAQGAPVLTYDLVNIATPWYTLSK